MVSCVAVTESIVCVIMIVIVSFVTYPLYIMTDRQRPELKQSFGLISTPTVGLYLTSIYSLLTILSNMKPLWKETWKVPLCVVTLLLLFYGACDVWNDIRYQNKRAKKDDKKYNDDEINPTNPRSNAIGVLFTIEVIGVGALLILALIRLNFCNTFLPTTQNKKDASSSAANETVETKDTPKDDPEA